MDPVGSPRVRVLDEARRALKEMRDSEPDDDRRENGHVLEHTHPGQVLVRFRGVIGAASLLSNLWDSRAI